MKIIEKESFRILKDEGNNFLSYLAFLKERGQLFENYNLVLDLQEVENVNNEKLLDLLPFSEEHKERKKSFVVVTTDVDIDNVPVELSVVPTLGEAEDLIQMEEIERELGF